MQAAAESPLPAALGRIITIAHAAASEGAASEASVADLLRHLATRKRFRVAGLMSGTSADGVDAAIVEFSRGKVELLGFRTVPYGAALRRQVFALFDARTACVEDLCHLNFVLGEVFAEALKKAAAGAGIPLESIHLVGSHGQTVCHLPRGRAWGRCQVRSTLQIGEPSVIAERTGITTVADFRPRDCAAGGEGAPLVPYADYVLFRHPTRGRAVQNIGGIANITYLPAGGARTDILAFDTGPGNMMIDRIASLASGGKKHMDAGGRLAAKGRVDVPLLASLMNHRFLRRPPPKSTGREEFGYALADRVYDCGRQAGLAPADILATVTALTAESIAEAYRRFLPRMPDEVILCGGGARNRTLRVRLAKTLAPARVTVSDEFGISADAKEAVSFAILARETILGRCGNVPAATGARRPVILGKVVP